MAPRRRPNRQKRRQNKNLLGALLIVVVLAATLVTGLTLWQLSKSRIEVDKDTFCPIAGAKETTVVLIDRTDSLNLVQQAALLQKLEDIKAETPKYGEIEIYTVGEISDALLRPEIKLCNPGRGEDVDPTIGNPRLVEKKWKDGFQVPLERVFKDMLQPGEAKTSPIAESIQSIALTSFDVERGGDVDKRLIVVSDMLQNTPEFSQYRGLTPFERVKQTDYYRHIQAHLDGVRVKIWYVRRPTARHIQGGAHIEFWQQFFMDEGAILEGVDALEG